MNLAKLTTLLLCPIVWAGCTSDPDPGPGIELHSTAMKQREAEHGPERMKLYLAEGRVRLLELMGHLVTFYRDRWLGGPRPGAADRESL